MYLENEIEKLFEIYPIYKKLSYRILLYDGEFREFDFFKKYGTLYSLLENLVTKKITINSANAGQIYFIIDLMHGYNKSKLVDTEAIKNDLFYDTVLTKAKKVFLDTKKNTRRGTKSFFPQKF